MAYSLNALERCPDSSLKIEIPDKTEGTLYSFYKLKKGDIITKIDNHNICSPKDLMKLAKVVSDGGKVSLSIIRKKRKGSAIFEFEPGRLKKMNNKAL
jgi:C-terminal processing protease CtpA/Prc